MPAATIQGWKKGAINTPPETSFFEMKNGGLKLLFQNRRSLKTQHDLPPQQRFFSFAVVAAGIS